MVGSLPVIKTKKVKKSTTKEDIFSPKFIKMLQVR